MILGAESRACSLRSDDAAHSSPELVNANAVAYDKCEFDANGAWIPPPKGVLNMSDENVYMAIKHLDGKTRGKDYPEVVGLTFRMS